MRRWIMGAAFCAAITMTMAGVAAAEYGYASSSAEKARAASTTDSFDRAVDLSRFRKGNYEWDTQEYLRSGFTALHGEHLQLLKELAALRAEVARLSSEVRRSSAEPRS